MIIADIAANISALEAADRARLEGMIADALPSVPLPHGWVPRYYQQPLWDYLDNDGRRAIMIAHRRWGKDDVLLHWTCVAAHQRVANYWHCLPQYEQARKAIWEAINPHSGKRRIDEVFPLFLRSRTDNSSMTIELNCGSIWKVVGSDDPNSLVGAPPAGIVFSEWAISNPSAWGYLAPILDENDGWAVFITTPRGRNHAYDMWRMANRSGSDWFAARQGVEDTGYSLASCRAAAARISLHLRDGMPATRSSSRNISAPSRRPSWARFGGARCRRPRPRGALATCPSTRH